MRADGRTHMTKLIGAFCDDASKPTNKYGGPTTCRKNVLFFNQSQCLEGKIIPSSNVLNIYRADNINNLNHSKLRSEFF
jgi:hypothetical protein